MTQQKCSLAMAAVVLAFAGCSGSGGSSSSGGGATPQAVFDNFKSATQAKDFQKAFAQTTPDSQEVVLGAMAMGLNMMAMLDPSKNTEANQILEKHGVKKLDMTGPPPNMNDPKSFMKQMVGGVKDKPACIAEIMTWMEKNSPNKDAAAAPARRNSKMPPWKMSKWKATRPAERSRPREPPEKKSKMPSFKKSATSG